jgi:hypothetical protein
MDPDQIVPSESRICIWSDICIEKVLENCGACNDCNSLGLGMIVKIMYGKALIRMSPISVMSALSLMTINICSVGNSMTFMMGLFCWQYPWRVLSLLSVWWLYFLFCLYPLARWCPWCPVMSMRLTFSWNLWLLRRLNVRRTIWCISLNQFDTFGAKQ